MIQEPVLTWPGLLSIGQSLVRDSPPQTAHGRIMAGHSRKIAHIALYVGLLGACGDAEKAGGASGNQGEQAKGAPTWHQDIAPLVNEKCVACHQGGGIGSFSMSTYETAKPFAKLMASAAEEGRMPPFLAIETDSCQPKLPWANDLRLSPSQKALLRAWADAGAPLGDPQSAPGLVEAKLTSLPREDVVLSLSEPIAVAGTKDLHTCVVLDPAFAADSFVTGRQITPGNAKILHHVVSYLIPPNSGESKDELIARVRAASGAEVGGRYDCFGGPRLPGIAFEMLDAWAPGGIPNLAPENSGQPVKKNSLLLLDLHYHPVGDVEEDSTTKLSLMLAEQRPDFISRTVLIGNFEKNMTIAQGVGDLVLQAGESVPEFMIPAGASGHVEEMTWTFKLPIDIHVMGMGTHMHYVGRDMQVNLAHKAPAEDQDPEECLIQTPAWDFNWQRGYGYDGSYEQLPRVSNGDTLKLRCVYDNSMQNKFVVQALASQGLEKPVEVRLGENTLDEMCLAAVGLIYPNFQ
jgi:hypothetical protein